jgi:hypothetical protein
MSHNKKNFNHKVKYVEEVKEVEDIHAAQLLSYAKTGKNDKPNKYKKHY